MKLARLLRYLYLARFSQPSADRTLYRAIWRQPPTRIVELGIGSARRSLRMIELAKRLRPETETIHYAGIDLFEARPEDAAGLTLKRAHRLLGGTNAKVRLVPGDPAMALKRTANVLLQTDLLVIAADQDRDALARAWFYVPRMLHEGSRVFREERVAGGDGRRFRLMERIEIDRLAAGGYRPLRAAA